MSKTFQFGNGEWAVGKETALAYNDENSNFKPLPFTFDRASSATVVNKQGLIETVGIDEPRIDFLNNTKGHLLLEPSRQNRVTNSSEFGDVITNTTITRNQITATDGTLTADRILDNSVNGEHLLGQNLTGLIVNGTTYVLSAFFKSDGTGGKGVLRFFTGSWQYAVFNLENGTVSFTSTGTSKIENYGNGWFRCSLAVTATSDYPLSIVQIGIGNSLNQFAYQGATSLGNYFWGVQFEEGSYATSYIPTQGSAVTRSAESCEQTTPDGVIGRTEGTVYFESEINGLQGGDMRFQLSDGSTNNWFFMSSGEATGIGVKARAYINNGNVNQFNAYSEYLSAGKHKYALAYNQNDIAFYVDGIQVSLDTSATIPSCDEITLSGSTPTNVNASHFLSYKDIKLYNTRLSNSELQALTS